MKTLVLLVVAALLVFLFEVLLIKWAVSLFYPINWTQAFGISFLVSILGAAVRSKNK
jgi:hypothetical protein